MPMPWTLDVEVESTPLSTTGGHTWAASRRLASYLSAAAEQPGLGRPGLRVLELGAGTGWLGCTVARNLHQTSLVCLTEQAGGLDWLRHNVHLNRQRGLPLAGVRVQACNWLDYAGSGAADGAAGGSGGGGSSGTGQIGQDSDQVAQTAAGCVAAQEPAACCSPDACSSEQQQEQHSCTHERQQQQGVGTAGTADGSRQQQVESGAACDPRSTEWDFLIGSDLIYNEVRQHNRAVAPEDCLPGHRPADKMRGAASPAPRWLAGAPRCAAGRSWAQLGVALSRSRWAALARGGGGGVVCVWGVGWGGPCS